MNIWDLYIKNLRTGKIPLYRSSSPHRRWTLEERNQLKKDWLDGIDIKTLMFKYNRTEDSIYCQIRDLDVHRQRGGRKKSKLKYDRKQIVHLYLRGFSIRQIAKMNKCTRQYISQVLKKENINTNLIIQAKRKLKKLKNKNKGDIL